MSLGSTREIIERAVRKDSANSYFSQFGDAWQSVRCQVLKLETKQYYHEPENPSWLAAQAGRWDEAVELIPSVRSADIELYADLKERGVEFLRCRPLAFPLSLYARWELGVYKFNADHGERIFCCNLRALDVIFDQFACHDFMVFDARIAFVHDYDEHGVVQGGWCVQNQDDLRALIGLFGFIKANSQPHTFFAPK